MSKAERAAARHGHREDDLGSRSYIVENKDAAVVTSKEGLAIAATYPRRSPVGRPMCNRRDPSLSLRIVAAAQHGPSSFKVSPRLHGRCPSMSLAPASPCDVDQVITKFCVARNMVHKI